MQVCRFRSESCYFLVLAAQNPPSPFPNPPPCQAKQLTRRWHRGCLRSSSFRFKLIRTKFGRTKLLHILNLISHICRSKQNRRYRRHSLLLRVAPRRHRRRHRHHQHRRRHRRHQHPLHPHKLLAVTPTPPEPLLLCPSAPRGHPLLLAGPC